MRDLYRTPANFGIPNPLGPRTHNWKGGPMDEGSLFHGPIYTRPAYTLPRIQRPLFGVGEDSLVQEGPAVGAVRMAAGVALIFGSLWLAEKFLLGDA
jgi:hypothetical protein